MSEAFDRFVCGEDRLASLLRALPAYEPSPALEAAFATAARQAHAACATLPFGFEPPASLDTSFLKMAARIDAAQAPRRAAILAQIGAGDSPQTVLGADLQSATADWLQAQAQPVRPASAAPKPARKAVWLGFSWFDLRLAGLMGILAAVAVQLLLTQLPDTEQIAVREAFNDNFLARVIPSDPQPSIASAEPSARTVSPPASAAPRAAAPPPPQPAPLPESAAPAHLRGEVADKQTEAALAGAHDSRAEALSAAPATTSEASPVALSEPVASPSPAPLSKENIMQLERALGEIAQDTTSPAEQMPPAGKKTSLPPSPTRLSAKRVADPQAALPASRMASAQSSPARSVSAHLSDAPAAIAAKLPAITAGQNWVIYSATPSRPEVLAWIEALRQSIPASHRPARFLVIEEAGSPDVLRIERALP